MKTAIQWVGTFTVAAIMLDIIILMATLLQIANGTYTPHITFWDAQVRLVIHLIH